MHNLVSRIFRPVERHIVNGTVLMSDVTREEHDNETQLYGPADVGMTCRLTHIVNNAW